MNRGAEHIEARIRAEELRHPLPAIIEGHPGPIAGLPLWVAVGHVPLGENESSRIDDHAGSTRHAHYRCRCRLSNLNDLRFDRPERLDLLRVRGGRSPIHHHIFLEDRSWIVHYLRWLRCIEPSATRIGRVKELRNRPTQIERSQGDEAAFFP